MLGWQNDFAPKNCCSTLKKKLKEKLFFLSLRRRKKTTIQNFLFLKICFRFFFCKKARPFLRLVYYLKSSPEPIRVENQNLLHSISLFRYEPAKIDLDKSVYDFISYQHSSLLHKSVTSHPRVLYARSSIYPFKGTPIFVQSKIWTSHPKVLYARSSIYPFKGTPIFG